jgi:hypothetical protein
LHGLGELDYRKFLSAEIMADGPGLFPGENVLGLSGLNRVMDKASFRCIKSHHFDDFKPDAFLQVR